MADRNPEYKMVAKNRRTRSILTADQQNHQRTRLMITTGKIVAQLNEYINFGHITLGRDKDGDLVQVGMTTERLNAMKLCLSKTLPDLHATEITRNNAYSGISDGDLLSKVAKLLEGRPDLTGPLLSKLGHVIDVSAEHQTAEACEPSTTASADEESTLECPEDSEPLPADSHSQQLSK